MIELRWQESVLQYRFKYDEEGFPKEWSPWLNAPMVDEDEAWENRRNNKMKGTI